MPNLIERLKSLFSKKVTTIKVESPVTPDVSAQLEECFSFFNHGDYTFTVRKVGDDEYYVFYDSIIFAKVKNIYETLIVDINVICTPLLAVLISQRMSLVMRLPVSFFRDFAYHLKNDNVEFFYGEAAASKMYKKPEEDTAKPVKEVGLRRVASTIN